MKTITYLFRTCSIFLRTIEWLEMWQFFYNYKNCSILLFGIFLSHLLVTNFSNWAKCWILHYRQIKEVEGSVRSSDFGKPESDVKNSYVAIYSARSLLVVVMLMMWLMYRWPSGCGSILGCEALYVKFFRLPSASINTQRRGQESVLFYGLVVNYFYNKHHHQQQSAQKYTKSTGRQADWLIGWRKKAPSTETWFQLSLSNGKRTDLVDSGVWIYRSIRESCGRGTQIGEGGEPTAAAIEESHLWRCAKWDQ